MRSDLFNPDHLERTGTETMVLQNPKLLRVALNGEMMARQGAMVAYQGRIDFAYEGAGGISRLLKRAVTGEGLPLMKMTGEGDVFLAQEARELFIITLDGDSLTVNGDNIVAFDPTLQWDIRRVQGVSMMAGGVFNTVLTGHGRVAISCHGTPVVLNVDAPTFADIQSAVAWSSTLQTSVRRTAGFSALIGRGSGEAFQLGFTGQGFVVVQSSEGPTVPPHNHGSGG